MKTLTLFISITVLLTLNYSCIEFAGRDGRDGIDGEDANVGAVIYDVEPSAWTGNIDGFTATLNVPEINNDVFEKGAVLVYMLRNEDTSDKSFNQLPYTWLNNNITEYIDFDAYIGHIDITLRWVDNGINNTQVPEDLFSFKVIVIEGTSLSVLENNTDISNPEAVLDYFSNPVLF